jgi:hypothetical protein
VFALIKVKVLKNNALLIFTRNPSGKSKRLDLRKKKIGVEKALEFIAIYFFTQYL